LARRLARQAYSARTFGRHHGNARPLALAMILIV
jgi:hypothetical protein